MNGKYEVDEHTFKALPQDEQNWMMFRTFNDYRVNVDKRITKIEKRKTLDTGIAATTGVFGGALAMMGKWFIFK